MSLQWGFDGSLTQAHGATHGDTIGEWISNQPCLERGRRKRVKVRKQRLKLLDAAGSVVVHVLLPSWP
eukprot:14355758-Alexandrium_andersonii.AAC.1